MFSSLLMPWSSKVPQIEPAPMSSQHACAQQCATNPAGSWGFLLGTGVEGLSTDLFLRRDSAPFKYSSVCILYYFSHKSTSVNHFICLFLERKCDYIEHCSHFKKALL